MFPLKPLEENRFHSCNAPFEIELDFNKAKEDDNWIIHTRVQGMKPDEMVKFDQVFPAREEMENFIGEYFSGELCAYGSFYLKKDKSFLKLGHIRL